MPLPQNYLCTINCIRACDGTRVAFCAVRHAASLRWRYAETDEAQRMNVDLGCLSLSETDAQKLSVTRYHQHAPDHWTADADGDCSPLVLLQARLPGGHPGVPMGHGTAGALT